MSGGNCVFPCRPRLDSSDRQEGLVTGRFRTIFPAKAPSGAGQQGEAYNARFDATNADLSFRQVAQDLPTPCWISDADGSIIWANAAWLAYTGMDVKVIQASGLQQLHDPAVLPLVRERWAKVKASGKPAEMTSPLKGRDGLLRFGGRHSRGSSGRRRPRRAA